MREIIIGLCIPVLGTVLGSAMVFLMKDKLNQKLEKTLLGFAAGVMVAASIWSLIIPSIDLSVSMGKWRVFPAAIGFALGIIFLLILDSIIPHLHVKSDAPEGIKSSKMRKTTMMVLAVTLHNIPEGMAFGVVLAGLYFGDNIITLGGAFALALGIAIQNFPEGAVVSMPLKAEGQSKLKAFGLGAFSGIVEPIASVVTILVTGFVTSILPYVLSFAAGAMIYVVIEELIPESQEGQHTNLATIGFSFGFILMMVLDIVLG